MSEIETREFQRSTNNLYRGIVAYKTFDDLVSKENQLPVPSTFADLMKTDSRQIGYVANMFGELSAASVVNDALVKTCLFLNYEISGEMIKRAAELIAEKYPLCKIADLKMFESFALSGGGQKRYRMDTRELCEMFDEYIHHREEAFEQIRIADKKKIEESKAIDDEKEYQFFVSKYAERLRTDYLASDKSMTMDEFCRLKFKPVENPIPLPEFRIGKKLQSQSIRDICARNGKDYDELLRKESERWGRQYQKSGVTDEMTFEDYARYRKTVFDNQLRKQLEA